MNNDSINENGSDINNLKKFKNNHILAKIIFIIGFSVLASSIIFMIVFTATQKPSLNGLYIILGIIASIAFIDLIIGSFTLGEKRSRYSISGFIFSLVVIIYHSIVIGLFATSGI